MLINGETNLAKKLIEIVTAEAKIFDEMMAIGKRLATAENLRDTEELKAIDKDGLECQKRINKFMGEKIIVMSVFVDRHKNFMLN